MSETSAGPEVQAALFNVLKANTTLMSYLTPYSGLTPIYDVVPLNAPLPYISFGDFIEIPWPVFGKRNSDIEFTLHIFTPGPEDVEAWAIYGETNKTIESEPLTLTNYTNLGVFLQMADLTVDEDGVTRHVIVRYRTQSETNN